MTEYAAEVLLALGLLVMSWIVWEIRGLRRKIDNGLSGMVARIDERVKVLWDKVMEG